MYSLAIVDDEPAILRGLTHRVDWNAMGFQVAGSFEDGEDALDHLSRNHVDVILTDIRMSVVSGLSLAATIHDAGIPTTVILLTGYKDFEYARAAMRAGVSHYLLKPAHHDELRSVFAEVRDELDAASTSRRSVRRLTSESRSKLLLRIVNGLVESEEELAREWRAALLPLPTTAAPVHYALLQADCGDADQALRVDLLCGEGSDGTTVAAAADHGRFHALALGRPDDATAAEVFEALAGARLHRRFADSLAVVCECTVSSLAQLYALPDTLPREAPTSTQQTLVEDIVDQFLENEGTEGISDRVQSLIIAAGRAGRLKGARRTAIDLAAGMKGELSRKRPETSGRPSIDYDRLFRSRSAEDAAHCVLKWLSSLAGPEAAEPNDGTAAAVATACRIVHANLADDLSLERVARALYLSPGYFSRVFKKHTGRTFIEYVTECRLDAAASTLRDHEVSSITAVAASVGYKDPKYFSRLFKSHTGRTPSQFRRLLRTRA